MKLKTIRDEISCSDLAVKLASGESVGKVSIDDLRRKIRILDQQIPSNCRCSSIAVEQLTGAVTARSGALTGATPTTASRIASALEDSEERLVDLKEKQREIDAELEKLRGANPKDKKAIEAAEHRKEVIDGQFERRQNLIERLKEVLARVEQSIQKLNTTQSSTGAGPQMSDPAVAHAVRAITVTREGVCRARIVRHSFLNRHWPPLAL